MNVVRDGQCWNCEYGLGDLGFFCDGCGKLQAPPKRDDTCYFDLFGIPKSFEVDLSHIDQKHRRMQMQLHPDKFANHSSVEQHLAGQCAAFVNEAHKTLRNDLLRAKLLLEGRGVQALQEGGRAMPPPELLQHVMEMRGVIEEATTREPLDAGRRDNRDRTEGVLKGLREAFAGDDVDAATALAIELRYYSRIEEQIVERLESLGFHE